MSFEKIDFIESFEQVKVEIKEKWLEYCEKNRSWLWLLKIQHNNWKKTGEEIEQELLAKLENRKAERPDNYIILAAISNIDPKVPKILSLFCQLTTDLDKLIEVLGLNFDPFLEIERRKLAKKKEIPSDEYLNQIREQI